MLVGYSRVSTNDQSLNSQIDKLKEFGCEKIFTDVISGTKSERKGLKEMLDYLRENDTVVVFRLDRLGRSLKDLIDIVNLFKNKNIHFKSISENIDTATPTGKLIFHITGAFAEFERNIIRERTKAGIPHLNLSACPAEPITKTKNSSNTLEDERSMPGSKFSQALQAASTRQNGSHPFLTLK